jgi:hemerythrin
MIVWKKKFDTGIKKIDKQHRKIAEILNTLYSLKDGSDPKKINRVFDDLQNYIIEHFKMEEEYMKTHGYSGLEQQIQEHGAFIDKFCEYQKGFLKYESFITINVFNFVWDWFSGHILGTDKKLLSKAIGHGH